MDGLEMASVSRPQRKTRLLIEGKPETRRREFIPHGRCVCGVMPPGEDRPRRSGGWLPHGEMGLPPERVRENLSDSDPV